MGNDLLRTLMTICDLGKDWKDLSKLPIDEIIEAWRAQSERGRYESAMWRAAGLEEPNVAQNRSCGGEREEAAEAGAQVDNMAAGGFFGRFGREGNAPVRPMVTPYVVGQTPTHT